MPEEIFVDTDILFAYCQEPEVELYGGIVRENFDMFRRKGIKYQITSSVKKEFDSVKEAMYNIIMQSLREIENTIEAKKEEKNQMLSLEKIISSIRRKTDRPKILNLVELRVVEKIKTKPNKKSINVRELIYDFLGEIAPLAAEVEKKYTELNFSQPIDVSGYEDIAATLKQIGVTGSDDRTHLAMIYEHAKKSRGAPLFITTDNNILANKEEIENKFSLLKITSPIYVPEKV